MSTRPGVLVSVSRPADGGVSPNRFKPFVTVEVRACWPPLATEGEVLVALDEARDRAVDAIAGCHIQEPAS